MRVTEMQTKFVLSKAAMRILAFHGQGPVIPLHAGELVEEGSFPSLIALEVGYAELWEAGLVKGVPGQTRTYVGRTTERTAVLTKYILTDEGIAWIRHVGLQLSGFAV
jgi:hypothetical protein